MTYSGHITTTRNGVKTTRPLPGWAGFLVFAAFVTFAVVPWLVGCIWLLFWLVRP